MDSLKDEVKEIVEIVALVPEAHKATCFEILLNEALAKRRVLSNAPATRRSPENVPTDVSESESNPAPVKAGDLPAGGVQPKVDAGTDITLTDLHIKTRKFLEKGGLSLKQLNEMFYKDGDGFQSLSVDLQVTKMSEAQIRIALLQALQRALASGDFETTVEAVREECKARKAYDLSNFTAILKNAAEFFDFGTWSKEVEILRLTEQGKAELALIIQQLAS